VEILKNNGVEASGPGDRTDTPGRLLTGILCNRQFWIYINIDVAAK
jgi:hypothetical protein